MKSIKVSTIQKMVEKNNVSKELEGKHISELCEMFNKENNNVKKMYIAKKIKDLCEDLKERLYDGGYIESYESVGYGLGKFLVGNNVFDGVDYDWVMYDIFNEEYTIEDFIWCALVDSNLDDTYGGFMNEIKYVEHDEYPEYELAYVFGEGNYLGIDMNKDELEFYEKIKDIEYCDYVDNYDDYEGVFDISDDLFDDVCEKVYYKLCEKYNLNKYELSADSSIDNGGYSWIDDYVDVFEKYNDGWFDDFLESMGFKFCNDIEYGVMYIGDEEDYKRFKQYCNE